MQKLVKLISELPLLQNAKSPEEAKQEMESLLYKRGNKIEKEAARVAKEENLNVQNFHYVVLKVTKVFDEEDRWVVCCDVFGEV